jgi:hypothetical protein
MPLMPADRGGGTLAAPRHRLTGDWPPHTDEKLMKG